jgi:hypothetical protein
VYCALMRNGCIWRDCKRKDSLWNVVALVLRPGLYLMAGRRPSSLPQLALLSSGLDVEECMLIVWRIRAMCVCVCVCVVEVCL